MDQSRIARLEEEQAAFDAQLAHLMREHAGEYVLFRSKQPVDFFDSYGKAYGEGLQRFGTQTPFLVSKVEQRRVESASVSWDLGVMFGG